LQPPADGVSLRLVEKVVQFLVFPPLLLECLQRQLVFGTKGGRLSFESVAFWAVKLRNRNQLNFNLTILDQQLTVLSRSSDMFPTMGLSFLFNFIALFKFEWISSISPRLGNKSTNCSCGNIWFSLRGR
jgi:hypothetical protein